MKFKLTKAQYDELSDDLKKEYQEQDGEYVLNVEGGEDTGALKRAKDHEKERRKQAEDKARDLETQLNSTKEELETLQNSKGDGEKDVAKLESKWKKKLEDKERELGEKSQSLEKELNTLLVDNVADRLAADLSDSPSVLRPHIKERLTVERVDGKAVTRIKDADGELSPMTLDELKSEFESNNDFASVVRGSKGSGSGAGGGQGGQGGQAPKKPDFAKASTKEVADYLKSQKETGA
jgi:chromosome segregation ATPase